MITFENVKEYKNIPFDQYTAFNGFSHSFLKSEINGVQPEFIMNDKIRLGSMVDAFLTQPEAVDFTSPLFEQARSIASEIKKHFGFALPLLEPQLSYTADMIYQGLIMPVCGRLDWLLRDHADIDLKVTNVKTDAQFKAIIDHMGYKNQQWNYARMAGVKKAYILPYSVPLKKCLGLVEVPVGDSNEFWVDKIKRFGSVKIC